MGSQLLPRDKKLRPYSTDLRNNATKEENHLWYDYLRKYPIRFNRQRIIGEYIVDFYCSRAKLVIELDGSQHYTEEAIEYDLIRTNFFEGADLVVLRFSNIDVNKKFDGVCMMIDAEVKRRMG